MNILNYLTQAQDSLSCLLNTTPDTEESQTTAIYQIAVPIIGTTILGYMCYPKIQAGFKKLRESYRIHMLQRGKQNSNITIERRARANLHFLRSHNISLLYRARDQLKFSSEEEVERSVKFVDSLYTLYEKDPKFITETTIDILAKAGVFANEIAKGLQTLLIDYPDKAFDDISSLDQGIIDSLVAAQNWAPYFATLLKKLYQHDPVFAKTETIQILTQYDREHPNFTITHLRYIENIIMAAKHYRSDIPSQTIIDNLKFQGDAIQFQEVKDTAEILCKQENLSKSTFEILALLVQERDSLKDFPITDAINTLIKHRKELVTPTILQALLEAPPSLRKSIAKGFATLYKVNPQLLDLTTMTNIREATIETHSWLEQIENWPLHHHRRLDTITNRFILGLSYLHDNKESDVAIHAQTIQDLINSREDADVFALTLQTLQDCNAALNARPNIRRLVQNAATSTEFIGRGLQALNQYNPQLVTQNNFDILVRAGKHAESMAEAIIIFRHYLKRQPEAAEIEILISARSQATLVTRMWAIFHQHMTPISIQAVQNWIASHRDMPNHSIPIDNVTEAIEGEALESIAFDHALLSQIQKNPNTHMLREDHQIWLTQGIQKLVHSRVKVTPSILYALMEARKQAFTMAQIFVMLYKHNKLLLGDEGIIQEIKTQLLKDPQLLS